MVLQDDADSSGLIDAARRLVALYRSGSTDDREWKVALAGFDRSLAIVSDADLLSVCVLEDVNWELPVSARLELTRKAWAQGGRSTAFLRQHYGYLGAHLDPGSEERVNAERSLSEISDAQD